MQYFPWSIGVRDLSVAYDGPRTQPSYLLRRAVVLVWLSLDLPIRLQSIILGWVLLAAVCECARHGLCVSPEFLRSAIISMGFCSLRFEDRQVAGTIF